MKVKNKMKKILRPVFPEMPEELVKNIYIGTISKEQAKTPITDQLKIKVEENLYTYSIFAIIDETPEDPKIRKEYNKALTKYKKDNMKWQISSLQNNIASCKKRLKSIK